VLIRKTTNWVEFTVQRYADIDIFSDLRFLMSILKQICCILSLHLHLIIHNNIVYVPGNAHLCIWYINFNGLVCIFILRPFESYFSFAENVLAYKANNSCMDFK